MDRLDHLNDLLREHDCVMSIDIKFDDFKYDLRLKLSADESGLDAVTLTFHDICALDMSGFGGGLTQFMHLAPVFFVRIPAFRPVITDASARG